VLCQECLDNVLVEWAVGRGDKDCRDCCRLIGSIQASTASQACYDVDYPEQLQPYPLDAITGTTPPRPAKKRKDGIIILRGRGDDINGMQPKASKKSTFLAESDQDLSASLLPSAKTTAVKDMILDWRRRYPTDKIIGKVPLC
jgi:hypothetical protein